MHDPLLVKTCLETVVADQILVMQDRFQMTGKIMPIVHSVSFPYRERTLPCHTITSIP